MIRYYVTDRRQGDVLRYAARAVSDGVDMIQIREKDLPACELFELACRVRDIAAGSKTKVLINDRLDVALASGVDGVHLPESGLPITRVRPLVSLVGASVHSVDRAVSAEKDGANFVVFGPIFETPGKVPVGLDALRKVTAAVRIPVLAIGGINAENIEAVMSAGAAGVAAIRLFQPTD
jgi:thiamine-phosphate pyrophosphorylase